MFNKYFLSTCSVLSPTQGSGDSGKTVVNETDMVPVFRKLSLKWKSKKEKKITVLPAP